MLTVDQLSHEYDSDIGVVPALDTVSLTIQKNEFVCLVGPSGCGKSTLLHIIGGLIKPTSGRVLLDGNLVTEPEQEIGIVFQKPTLLPWRKVIDNITLPLELAKVDKSERLASAQELIELVGLEGFEESYPSELSGGMAQRVAIARALIQKPEILLLDEPFGALDALTREYLGEELLRIWHASKTTVLMVTHSISESLLLSDRVLVMSQRPGTIQSAFDVGLPRPRSLEQMHHAEAAQISSSIREAIRHGQ